MTAPKKHTLVADSIDATHEEEAHAKHEETIDDTHKETIDAKQEETIDNFIYALSTYEGPQVFNPWRNYDPRYDQSVMAPQIRRKLLKAYLWDRLGKASYVIVAEAMGYQGGHFTGIPITCERMLLGHHKEIGLADVLSEAGRTAAQVTDDELRTSHFETTYIPKAIQRKKGFNEPTDTVVWGAIKEAAIPMAETLLWNIFPFHPYKEGNMLTNRTPSASELEIGRQAMEVLLELHDQGQIKKICAVGQKAKGILDTFGVEAIPLRHPANGGAREYREGFRKALMKE